MTANDNFFSSQNLLSNESYISFIPVSISPSNLTDRNSILEESLRTSSSSISEKTKLQRIYDQYSKNFIFSDNKQLQIITSKGMNFLTLICQPPKSKSSKITFLSIDETKAFLVETRDYSTLFFRCLNQNLYSIIFTSKKEKLLGAFFLPESECLEIKKKIIILTESFITINEVYINYDKEISFSKEAIYRKNININNFYYNQQFRILIIKCGLHFFVFNLKNLNNIKNIYSFQAKNYLNISQFFLVTLYNKLYFIHLSENHIQLYKLENLQDIKPTKTICFQNDLPDNTKKLGANLIQFCDNLILLYCAQNILIYDIKQKNNYNIGNIELDKNIFSKDNSISIYDDLLFYNDIFYKVQFNNSYFNLNSNCNTMDTFFTILRRNNHKENAFNILVDLISKFQITNLKNIFIKLVKIIYNNTTQNSNVILINSKNENIEESVTKLENLKNFISQQKIFEAFLDPKTSNITAERKIKILCTLPSLISNKIALDQIFFIILEKIIDDNTFTNFTFLDSIIKNKGIPLNEQFACFLLDKASEISDKKQQKKLFNLGIDILIQLKENDIIVSQLIQNKKYIDSIYELYRNFIDKKKLKKIKKNYFNEAQAVCYVEEAIKRISNIIPDFEDLSTNA